LKTLHACKQGAASFNPPGGQNRGSFRMIRFMEITIDMADLSKDGHTIEAGSHFE
jgi:hypothetical protein